MGLQSRKKVPILTLTLTILLIGSLVFGGMYFKKYNDLKKKSSQTAEDANKALISKVGKVYQLPSGETPVVLNVNKDPKDFTTDQEKAFATTFKDLKKDDVILLYEKASLAIEYRPSENKVISTASLAINTSTNVALIATADSQTTLTNLLTTKLASDVKVGGKATPTAQYTTTTVVDLTGKKTEIAKKVADAVGGTVASSLPAGEAAPEGAEIVVVAANASPAPAQ